MSRTLFRLLAGAIVSGALISAQEPDYTLKVDVPFVSVDVTVEDANGETVNDLPRSAFEVYENGTRQEIRAFLPVSTPYNVLLLFDRSGSTQGKWSLMQRAVAGFIANLRPQDRIELATFDYELKVQLPWTSDRRKGLESLPELINATRLGSTEFYAAVEKSLRQEFKKANGRRALVVLTDGRDNYLYNEFVRNNRLLEPKAERPFQNALKAAVSQHIPVYFVAFNTDKNLETNVVGADEYRNLQLIFPRSTAADRYLAAVRLRMEQIAESSGGRILFPKRLEDIVPLYQQIGRELGMAYSLGYVSSNPAMDGSFRRIEVRLRSADLKLTQSRAGYLAK